MTKILLLCAILAALCGSAHAQFGTPYPHPYDPYQNDRPIYRDQPSSLLPDPPDYRIQQLERQLEQQRDDAQFREHQLQEQLLREQLLDNFGCDIHNHCR